MNRPRAALCWTRSRVRVWQALFVLAAFTLFFAEFSHRRWLAFPGILLLVVGLYELLRADAERAKKQAKEVKHK